MRRHRQLVPREGFGIPFRNRGAPLHDQAPQAPGAAEALGVSPTSCGRASSAIRFVLLADYSSFAGAQGQQLLGFDLVLDADGNVHVLEANRTPGTTEDDAGRKRRMHQGWATMTGGFAGAAYRASGGCRSGGLLQAPRARRRLRRRAAASGGAPRALERELLFERESARSPPPPTPAPAPPAAGGGRSSTRGARRWCATPPATSRCSTAARRLARRCVRRCASARLLGWLEQNNT